MAAMIWTSKHHTNNIYIPDRTNRYGRMEIQTPSGCKPVLPFHHPLDGRVSRLGTSDLSSFECTLTSVAIVQIVLGVHWLYLNYNETIQYNSILCHERAVYTHDLHELDIYSVCRHISKRDINSNFKFIATFKIHEIIYLRFPHQYY